MEPGNRWRGASPREWHLFDLVLKGGRVLDPGRNVDRIADVAFAGGKVAAMDADIPADKAQSTIDVAGRIVTPGLIDLHTHVYWGGTSLGVDADRIARRSGTTTFIDAGSSGPGNFLGFRHHVMERSRVRILAYLNISFAGIFAFSKTVMVGENLDVRLLQPTRGRRLRPGSSRPHCRDEGAHRPGHQRCSRRRALQCRPRCRRQAAAAVDDAPRFPGRRGATRSSTTCARAT